MKWKIYLREKKKKWKCWKEIWKKDRKVDKTDEDEENFNKVLECKTIYEIDSGGRGLNRREGSSIPNGTRIKKMALELITTGKYSRESYT